MALMKTFITSVYDIVHLLPGFVQILSVAIQLRVACVGSFCVKIAGWNI